MKSSLVLTSVEELQDKITSEVKGLNSDIGIFISLNKTQKSTEEILKHNGVNVDKIFFIDCVTIEKTREDVLHIKPDDLDTLNEATITFIKDIEGKKFLIIDALSTLLIYNSENKVAKFVQELTSYASSNNVQIIAFSPKTQGEELLAKIFNFFDEVKQ